MRKHMDVSPTVVRMARLLTILFLIGAMSFSMHLASATVLRVEVVYLLVSCITYCLVMYMAASAYASRYRAQATCHARRGRW